MVTELNADMGGVWEVETQGSTHIWNLDLLTITKNPKMHSQSVGFRAEDIARPRTIHEVRRWPKVGDTFFVIYEDGRFHRSSTIKSITSLEEEPDVRASSDA